MLCITIPTIPRPATANVVSILFAFNASSLGMKNILPSSRGWCERMTADEFQILHFNLSWFNKTSSVGINCLHEKENKIPYRYFFLGLHLVQTMSLKYADMYCIHKDGSNPFCTTVGEANVMHQLVQLIYCGIIVVVILQHRKSSPGFLLALWIVTSSVDPRE